MGIDSLLSLCGFQGSNLGHQSRGKHLYPLNHLTGQGTSRNVNFRRLSNVNNHLSPKGKKNKTKQRVASFYISENLSVSNLVKIA